MHRNQALRVKDGDGAASFESQIETDMGSTLLSLVKRIPAIWATRRRAHAIVASLPDFHASVPLPDADTLLGWIEDLCATEHRRPGSPEGRRGEDWLADRLRGFGVEQVTKDPIPIRVWSARRWSLRFPDEEMPSFFVVNTSFTGAEGVTAPLAYVGAGTPSDFAACSVAGKIVVADVPFPTLPTGVLMKLIRACYFLSDPEPDIRLRTRQVMNFARQNFLGGDTLESAPERDVYWQAVRRGAKGICLILRDQPTNSNTHYGPYDGIMKPLPGLWIGRDDGCRLRALAKDGVEATLTLEGEMEEGETHNVWGVLPGRSEEAILVTSHHDSPFQGATEDGAGVAQVLAQAWAWSKVPAGERPKTLVFVLTAGHFYGSIGCDTFVREHPEILERAKLAITLEHLGAKEVEARDDTYVPTGRSAFTVMFTTPQPEIVATAIKALRAKPARATALVPADLFGPAPTSDASGYVLGANLPVISWIGCPYYLLDQHDTLDKVERNDLLPICETAAELVKAHMALPVLRR